MSPELPYCLKVLAALGPTLAATATLLVGIMVATVAYRQWHTAHQKLVLDLFERRLSIYKELEDAAVEFEASQGRSTVAVSKGREAFRKAKFLFGKEAFGHVNSFYSALVAFQTIPAEILMYDSEKVAREAMQKGNEAAMETVKAFRKNMPNTFEAYLRMEQKLGG